MNKSILKTALAAGTLLLCANSAAAAAYQHYANVTANTNPSSVAQVYVTNDDLDPASINYSNPGTTFKKLTTGESFAPTDPS